MKKIIHQFSIIAIILLLGACSNDEIFEKNDNNPAPGKRRTLSITATMPGDKSDGPNTRVDLEQLGDKSIELTWEKTDELQLAFVQGETKIKGIATMMSVSDDGKKAQFDMLIPDEITDGVFDLYGVYGGGGLDKTDPTLAKLPENAGDAGSLTDIQTRKDVMLHFVSKDISIANPKISAVFKHLGSLFSITIKNTGSTSLDNLTEARLVGVGENKKWAYNIGAGGSSYDLVSGEFQNMEGAGNYISFKVDESTVISEETITFWCWYPPLPEKVWPELKLELTTTNTLISINTKPERTEPTEAGKSFNFFAVWDGSQLGFSDIDFNPSVGGPGVYHVETMGTLGALLGDDKANISAMKLTGEINDVDFEVMKGKMPKLRYLDLSDVTCEYDRIPPRAFGGDWVSNTHISTIILPKSITEIYTDAFYGCTGLTGTLTLPDGLTSIGYGAFQGCKNLVGTLIIPNGIDKIEGSVFSGCSGLTGLTIPNELREIKSHAFYNCSNITGTIIFPVSIYNIGESGFEGCSNITAFRFPPFYDFEYTPNMLPSGVTVEVQSSALARYKVADGWKDHPIVAYDVTFFFVETMGSLGALIGDDKTTISAMKLTGQINKADFDVIKNEMSDLRYLDLTDVICQDNKIPAEAFGGSSNPNTDIINIIFPESITSIESSAFYGCIGLEGDLIIPDGVTTIGESAFRRCYGFDGTLRLSSRLESIGGYAFSGCSKLTGPLILPSTLKSIGEYGFAGCSGFTGSLTIPDGMTKIEEWAFYRCAKLTGTLIIPDGITTIGNSTFEYCEGFNQLILGNNITTIGENAFLHCSGFTGTVTFPQTLESIGPGGFYSHSKVAAFRFPHTTPFTYSDYMLPDGKSVEVPSSAVNIYKTAAGWKNHTIVGY